MMRDKPEAAVQPTTGTTVKVFDNVKPKSALTRSAYEQQINSRLPNTTQSMPRVTFNAKEVYTQVSQLNGCIPSWQGERDNPINTFVPASE